MLKHFNNTNVLKDREVFPNKFAKPALNIYQIYIHENASIKNGAIFKSSSYILDNLYKSTHTVLGRLEENICNDS